MRKAAVAITLVTVLFAPGARAAGEVGQPHTILEADTARGTALGSSWASQQSYSVSVLSLWESGQGFGARFSLLPPLSAAAPWEFSADAVARLANESPWYLKGIGGLAVAPPDDWWPPRFRAGVEVGLTALRGGIGLEAGLAATVSFPPARPLEGQVVVSLRVGLLFGFGAPSPSPGFSCREAPTALPAQRQQALRGSPGGTSVPYRLAAYSPASPAVGLAFATAPMGGSFNTCEGSATPQCVQAMFEGEGATSTTSATSAPASGSTSATAAPAQAEGATSSTAPGAAPSVEPPKLLGLQVVLGAAASLKAAMGFKSDEQRDHEARTARLMQESARTLETLKREQAQRRSADEGRKHQLPGREPSLPRKEPGGTEAPRVDSETSAPFSAPVTSMDQAIAEPDGEVQSPLELHNPHGQHGKPDHQATVERLKDLAGLEFPNAKIEAGSSIKPYTGVNRRPDVWAFDTVTKKVLKVYEAARINPDGSLPEREQLKKLEYDRAGIPSHFVPVTP